MIILQQEHRPLPPAAFMLQKVMFLSHASHEEKFQGVAAKCFGLRV